MSFVYSVYIHEMISFLYIFLEALHFRTAPVHATTIQLAESVRHPSVLSLVSFQQIARTVVHACTMHYRQQVLVYAIRTHGQVCVCVSQRQTNLKVDSD